MGVLKKVNWIFDHTNTDIKPLNKKVGNKEENPPSHASRG